MEWTICVDKAVYVDPKTGAPSFDQSIPSSFSVLPNVIQKSVRTVIVHGLAVWFVMRSVVLVAQAITLFIQDFILLAEGTRITIQWDRFCMLTMRHYLIWNRNMTWNGYQGFQSPIQDESFTIKDMGVLGNTHTERNLTCMYFKTCPCFPCSQQPLDVEFYYSGHMTPRKSEPWC